MHVGVSIVTSLYYSAAHLDEFCERAARAAQAVSSSWEIILVNDGSPDDSLALARAWIQRDARVRVIDLARHYGHYDALMTGLRRCSGERVFLIDCDLEEAPELLGEFWARLESDAELDLVVGVQRERRGPIWNQWAGRAFYKLLQSGSGLPIVADSLVARLMTRQYVDALTSLPERPISFDALAGATGFRWAEVPCAKTSTSATTYTLGRKLRLAGKSLAAYARWWPALAAAAAIALSAIGLACLVYARIAHGRPPRADAAWLIVAAVSLVGGLVMGAAAVALAQLRILLEEARRRPILVRREYPGG
jgi:putative glycosyltransferase